jgi:hypothetical protein
MELLHGRNSFVHEEVKNVPQSTGIKPQEAINITEHKAEVTHKSVICLSSENIIHLHHLIP